MQRCESSTMVWASGGQFSTPELDSGNSCADEDARLAAEAVEDVFRGWPRPRRGGSAAHVAIELDEPAVVVVAAVGIAGARRDPVGALQKDRRAVDLAYPGLGVFRRALAREPARRLNPTTRSSRQARPGCWLAGGACRSSRGRRRWATTAPRECRRGECRGGRARSCPNRGRVSASAVNEHNGDLADLGGRHDERIGSAAPPRRGPCGYRRRATRGYGWDRSRTAPRS